MYLDKIHFGHTRAQNGAMTSVGPVLFKIWSNYINSFCFACFKLLFIFFPLGRSPCLRYRSILDHSFRFVQTQSNYLLSSRFMLHAMRKKHFVNISLWCEFAPPWNRVDLLHSASSNSIRLYCHYLYTHWRWASSTSTTWPDCLIMVTVTFAGLHYQRHFQTCFNHCQNTSCFDTLSKAAVQT